MDPLLGAAIGFGLESTAWWRVSRGASVWLWMTPVLASLGVASILAGPPPWSPDVAASTALVVGTGLGLVLYLATRIFFVIAGRWDLLRRHSIEMYERQGELSLGVALLLSIGLSVPGEELFWRGFVQLQVADALGGAAGQAAFIALGAFVVANAFSRNLAIIAGAIVGGAVWFGLFWWTGGVAACLACHVVWTGLMLAFPVVRVPEAS